MLTEESRKHLIENYTHHVGVHGVAPGATQNSPEGQKMRFDQLLKLADLRGHTVLDLGCGIGDLLPALEAEFGPLDYTGIDLTPEMIATASKRFPEKKFFCRDVLRDGFPGEYDYGLICGVFNNYIPECGTLMREMLAATFKQCRIGLGFNFTSTYVNYQTEGMFYHDPCDVLRFVIENLSRKVLMHHHYGRCDVSVFVYREDLAG